MLLLDRRGSTQFPNVLKWFVRAMHRFFVVTGIPASGKSVVGGAVAERLGLPLYDKDVILEALFEGLGVGDASWRRRLSRAADEVLRRLALGSPGAVLVSWWRHPHSSIESGTSTDWLASLPGAVTELHCRCSPEVALERFVGRQRHVGHLDSSQAPADLRASFEQAARHGPLGIRRLVVVDTESPWELSAVLDELRPWESPTGEMPRV